MEQLIPSAVVGCGRMGAVTSAGVRAHAPPCWFPLAHAEAIAAHPALRLKAVCDIDGEVANRAAATHGAERAYTDVAQMLREVQPRLLSIATRTIGRAVLIEAAFDAGVRALHVEKPLCNSVAELARLRTLFAREDLFVTYGAVRRWFPVYRHARALAESGRWGALREIRVALGSGALYWTHPHSWDLLLFAAGGRQVASVQGRLADLRHAEGRPRHVESDPRVVAALVHFDDGVCGVVTQAQGADLVLSCERGEIAVRADGAVLEAYDTPEGRAYPERRALELPAEADALGGTLAPVAQLALCLRDDAAARQANAALRADILLGQQIAFALLQSHAEGSRAVAPADVDPDWFVEALSGGRHA